MQFRKNKNYNKASTNKTPKLNKIHLERYILTTSTIIGWSSYFSFYKNWIISSKRSKLFKNLIVEFKIDWFVLALKHSNAYKRMFKSFSSALFVRNEGTVYISPRSSVLIVEYSLERKRKWSFVSVSRRHLHIGSTVSLKACLNLCSFKWLKFNLRRFSSLRPLVSCITTTEFYLGLIKQDYFFKFI